MNLTCPVCQKPLHRKVEDPSAPNPAYLVRYILLPGISSVLCAEGSMTTMICSNGHRSFMLFDELDALESLEPK